MKFFHYTKPEQSQFLCSLIQVCYPNLETQVGLGSYLVLSNKLEVVSPEHWELHQKSYLNPLEEIVWNPLCDYTDYTKPEDYDSVREFLVKCGCDGVVKDASHKIIYTPAGSFLRLDTMASEEEILLGTLLSNPNGVVVQTPRSEFMDKATESQSLLKEFKENTKLFMDEVQRVESDPLGKSQHEKGSKLDSGKSEPSLILGSMSKALQAVIEVADYGKQKYTENGWLEVPEAEKRYTDAMLRHYLAEQQEDLDKDSGLLHSAHLAWNALARLHFILWKHNKWVELKAEGYDAVHDFPQEYSCVSGLRHVVQPEINKPLSPVQTKTVGTVAPLVLGTEEYEKALALWNRILAERMVVHKTDEFLYFKVYSPAYLSDRLIEVWKHYVPFYNQKCLSWEGQHYYSMVTDPSKAVSYYVRVNEDTIIGFN